MNMNCSEDDIKLYQLSGWDDNPERLIAYFEMLDSSFEPPLSSYVDIEHYAKKLLRFAYISILEYKGEFAGLMAVYVNDTKNKTGYLSSIGVLDKYKGKGLSVILMDHALAVFRRAGMKTIRLEVKSSYMRAIKFYEKYGFCPCEEKVNNDSSIYLCKNL